MLVYNYDQLSGIYIDYNEAHPDQMSPGDFHCPAHATFLAPPEETEGKLAKFTRTGTRPNDGSWSLIDDPSIAARALQARMARFVVYYRAQQGKDNAVYRIIPFAQARDLSKGNDSDALMIPDGQGAAIVDSNPTAVSMTSAIGLTISITNNNGIPLKKWNGQTVVDRDPADIYLDDTTAQAMRFHVFYRDKVGFDKKIVMIVADYAVQGNRVPEGRSAAEIAHNLGPNVAFFSVDKTDTVWGYELPIKANGVTVMVADPQNRNVVARDALRIAKDPLQADPIRATADASMAQALYARLGVKESPEMHAFILADLKDQLEMAEENGLNQAQKDALNAKLAVYRQAFKDIAQIRAARDLAITQLDKE